MQPSILLYSVLCSAVSAAHLSLNSGSLDKISCGSQCLVGLDCSQSAIDSFTSCISSECDIDDTTVARTIEKFMGSCRTTHSQTLDTEALDDLKMLYVSAQMTIMKRQAESMAANGTASGNGTNSSNSSSTNGSTSSSGTGATSASSSGASCTDLTSVFDRECKATSGANKLAVSGFLALVGAGGLAVLAI